MWVDHLKDSIVNSTIKDVINAIQSFDNAIATSWTVIHTNLAAVVNNQAAIATELEQTIEDLGDTRNYVDEVRDELVTDERIQEAILTAESIKDFADNYADTLNAIPVFGDLVSGLMKIADSGVFKATTNGILMLRKVVSSIQAFTNGMIHREMDLHRIAAKDLKIDMTGDNVQMLAQSIRTSMIGRTIMLDRLALFSSTGQGDRALIPKMVPTLSVYIGLRHPEIGSQHHLYGLPEIRDILFIFRWPASIGSHTGLSPSIGTESHTGKSINLMLLVSPGNSKDVLSGKSELSFLRQTTMFEVTTYASGVKPTSSKIGSLGDDIKYEMSSASFKGTYPLYSNYSYAEMSTKLMAESYYGKSTEIMTIYRKILDHFSTPIPTSFTSLIPDVTTLQAKKLLYSMHKPYSLFGMNFVGSYPTDFDELVSLAAGNDINGTPFPANYGGTLSDHVTNNGTYGTSIIESLSSVLIIDTPISETYSTTTKTSKYDGYWEHYTSIS
jgi:hypothetical protein